MDMAKRALLRELGIDVWLLRTAPETLAEEPVLAARSSRVVATGASTEASAEPSSQTADPLPESSVAEPVKTANVKTDIAVVCVSAPGVLLLHESRQPHGVGKSNSRLVTDLLAATAGDWQISVREAQFTWPPAGVTKLQSQDGCRALGAFVEKQLQECDARWVLATDTVVNWLAGGLPGDKLIGIPPLQNLSADSEQKKRLWRQIQTRLT